MHISEKYGKYFTKEYMMGPNAVRLLDEMLRRYPLKKCVRVLDMGCGTGLSSLALSDKTDAQITALDLWCSAEDNLRRIRRWGKEASIIPVHADATQHPFADDSFDAVVSVDAYHYFGCDEIFFAEYVLPLVRRGGQVLIIVPGLHEEFGEAVPEEILEWAGDEYKLFHSCDWWRETIGLHPDIARAEFVELECTDKAWQEWFASEHEYAKRDKVFFDKGIGKYLNFVGIAVTKAE